MQALRLHSSPCFSRCLGSSGSIDISGTVGFRGRQRRLGGLEKWHVRLTIESLPVALQLALLLLGLALSLCPHTFFTFAATSHYDRPYQTPYTVVPSYPQLSILNKLPSGQRLRRSVQSGSSHHYLSPYLPSRSSTLCTTIPQVRVSPSQERTGESSSRLPRI